MAAWEQVLDELVRVRGRALVRYATLLTGDERAGEDLVQDALVRCFSAGRPLRDTVAAEAYVRKAVLSTFLDGHRRRARWSAVRHLFARDDDVPGHEATSGARVDVRAALLTLRPRLRACVVLRYYDDLTVPEIGRRLDVAEGTVKRYLADATAQLEALLGPLPDTETVDIELVTNGKERS
ncbi:sigma-70 family RNA polymerase sigma factor [Cellulomonas sp.]|uniref:sigma-70 family RNA polymerase sigma factor n=1 Tax=Cellulomonas sp. TaxID=40001 RepID=UPI001B1C53FC|nr:sigma-70 family RNA polymerase sigma factor [Cellulomonas sp.]MBO9555449.1 sigma-70 family RNA polymerase sigma factor [Cellulomonas sp.]